MKLRRRMLCVAAATTLLLMLGLLFAQGVTTALHGRVQARSQLSLVNRACVERLDAMLQTARTQAQLLAELDGPKLLAYHRTVAAAQAQGGPVPVAPPLQDVLWQPQEKGMHVVLLDENSVVVYTTEAAHVGESVQLDEKSLQAARAGRAFVTPRQESMWQGAVPSAAVLHPVMEDGVYRGCVLVSVDMEAMHSVVQQTGAALDGDVALFDGAGKVASFYGNVPYTTLLELMNQSTLRSEMQPDEPFSYSMRGVEFIATYAGLQQANWNVLCTLDPKARRAAPLWQLLPLGVVALCAVVLCLGLNAVLCRDYSRPMTLLQESIKDIEAGDYSKSVPYLGKLELGDVGEAFNAMLACIRRDHTELVVKEARHRIINEQTNSIIFEYNLEADTMQCSRNGRMLADYPSCMDRFPEMLIAACCVNTAESKRLEALFCEMKRGRKACEMDLQLRTYNDKLCWFHLQLSAIADETSLKPLRVVGKLTDIDESKREAQQLAYRAKRDALTGLYNKETTHSSIVQRLAARADNRISALFVADLDCFKRVNDGYGHQKGDEILAQVAQVLKKTMGANDIVGRMGGDEFMLLMSDAENVDEVERAAQAIVAGVRGVILDAAKNDVMSLSVGVALCPQDGVTYQQLYAHADNAAYAAKRGGKNGYAFYREDA